MHKIAALVSGGMDSSILTVELARAGYEVHPLYMQHGLYWETVELEHLRRFLATVNHPNILPLAVLGLPVADIYGDHWSVSGERVPDETTADDAVYLPGRNLLLLAKAGIWCATNGIGQIALAPLNGNPFSDNTDEFYRTMENAINLALEWPLKVIRPFSTKGKSDVIDLGRNLPLHLTFSCIKPVNNLHCGRCNKCAERMLTYRHLGLNDETSYFVAE